MRERGWENADTDCYQQYLLYPWCPFCSCDVLQVMACGEMWQGTDWGDGGGRVV